MIAVSRKTPEVVGGYSERKFVVLPTLALLVLCLDLACAFTITPANIRSSFVTHKSTKKSGGSLSATGGDPNDNKNENENSSILMTFDLDDTLFPIQEVVDAANDAQIKAMQSFGYKESNMEQCMVQTRAIRQSLTGSITYTDLRKGAIRAELKQLSSSKNYGNSVDLEQQVEQCFEAWLQARHDASEHYLFPQALPALQSLQDTFSSTHNLCIAAITNGRGNPLGMTNTLAPYFDFCVSGEDDDVFPHRKPHSEIYMAALKRWQALPSQKEQKQDKDDDDLIRPDIWIHIGDCLANDVGASNDVGAHAIWVAPVESSEADGTQPSWSTATEKDRQERAMLMEAARSKMSGQITCLSQLNSVVQSILLKQTAVSSSATEDSLVGSTETEK